MVLLLRVIVGKVQDNNTLTLTGSRSLIADSLPVVFCVIDYYHNVMVQGCFFAPTGTGVPS